MATVSDTAVEVGVRVGVGESADVGVAEGGTEVDVGDPAVGEGRTEVGVREGGGEVAGAPPL